MSVVYWYKYFYVSIMLNHVPSKQIGLHNNGINWFKFAIPKYQNNANMPLVIVIYEKVYYVTHKFV